VMDGAEISSKLVFDQRDRIENPLRSDALAARASRRSQAALHRVVAPCWGAARTVACAARRAAAVAVATE
jgi:hypothetical protein